MKNYLMQNQLFFPKDLINNLKQHDCLLESLDEYVVEAGNIWIRCRSRYNVTGIDNFKIKTKNFKG